MLINVPQGRAQRKATGRFTLWRQGRLSSRKPFINDLLLSLF